MSENKKKFEAEAKEFFADAKNSNVNKIYITSDGNMFRAEHYADGWKTNLKDQEVEVHERKVKTLVPENENTSSTATNSEDENKGSTEKLREELLKEYIELFDTKPAHNISIEKLQDKITAKKLELADISKSDEEE